ncbi:MAG: diadenylate cyclase CdaA [Cytophagales bacterium]|nr:diadenylate cyclase CdaA [Cytophagales bacterium]
MGKLFEIGFLEVQWIDALDILLVSFLFYQLYKVLRGSIALKIFIGLLGLYIFYLLIKAAQMDLLATILGNFMGVGIIGVIILFQQEIRKFLLIASKNASKDKGFLKSIFFRTKERSLTTDIASIVDAAKSLSGTSTGALIVIAKGSELRLYAETGDEMDATISKRLIVSVFNKYSPLHDGALIVVNNRIMAARCILPVSEDATLPAFLGLRHRAAIGISELTDCVVITVSEETGAISLARNGKLYHNLSASELRSKLNIFLYGSDEEIEREDVKSHDVFAAQKEELAQ